jgi:hypothetical protein
MPPTSTGGSDRRSRQRALAESEPDFDPLPILEVLVRHDVQFILIGAAAAIAQGSPIPTEDVDITPARDRENLERLAAALQELRAELRTPTEPVEFPVDGPFLNVGEIWTLVTPYGDLDISFIPSGTRGYEDLRRNSVELELGPGVQVQVASLADVIRSKQAAGRLKDLGQLPALRQTLEVLRERERGQS